MHLTFSISTDTLLHDLLQGIVVTHFSVWIGVGTFPGRSGFTFLCLDHCVRVCDLLVFFFRVSVFVREQRHRCDEDFWILWVLELRLRSRFRDTTSASGSFDFNNEVNHFGMRAVMEYLATNTGCTGPSAVLACSSSSGRRCLSLGVCLSGDFSHCLHVLLCGQLLHSRVLQAPSGSNWRRLQVSFLSFMFSPTQPKVCLTIQCRMWASLRDRFWLPWAQDGFQVAT